MSHGEKNLKRAGFMSNKKDGGYSNKKDKTQKVLVFQPYPFQVGQKIFIESGPRRGDWEVSALGDQKVRLRCPISQREVEWDRFCYLVEERNDIWPHPD
jgi:hypothetical protein